MDAEELTKNMIKNINDEDLAGAKSNFERLIANKLYDRLEDKKEGLGKTMFSKDGQQNNQSDDEEEENRQTGQKGQEKAGQSGGKSSRRKPSSTLPLLRDTPAAG